MRVRRLDKDGDMTFGSGGLNFLQDSADAVAQNIYTNLKLFLGEWFWDKSAGTDWFGKCLGKNTTTSAYNEIKRVILSVEGVTSVEDLSLSSDTDSRAITITGNVATKYGIVSLSYKSIGDKYG